MDATLTKEVAVETIVTESKDELIKELSNIELMLVGGGLANFAFA